MATTKNMRTVDRFITTHDTEGQSVFSTQIADAIPFVQLPGDAQFGLCYATNGTPASLKEEKDVNVYMDYLKNLPGVMIPGGSVMRYVDFPPGLTSPMHRTISIDYGIVIEGEIELILDSGEKRLMKRGDVSIQRGTMHAWRNTSATEWARMLYVLLEAKDLEIKGKKLEEDYGGIPLNKDGGNPST